MTLRKMWKKQLLYCVGFFFAMLAVGVLIHNGFIIIIGTIVMCGSAVVAEWGLRCPNCRESLFKEALERGATEFKCPKCEKTITLE